MYCLKVIIRMSAFRTHTTSLLFALAPSCCTSQLQQLEGSRCSCLGCTTSKPPVDSVYHAVKYTIQSLLHNLHSTVSSPVSYSLSMMFLRYSRSTLPSAATSLARPAWRSSSRHTCHITSFIQLAANQHSKVCAAYSIYCFTTQ